jgi:hypothetical protein
METVSCQSSTSNPSSNRSQESPLFHNYSDLESSLGTLVYLPSWFWLWDSVSTRHLARESWRAISSFRIWTSSGGWGLRPVEPDFIQPRAISSCNKNQHPPKLIPCQGHQDGNWGRHLGYQHQEGTLGMTKERKSWWSRSIWATRRTSPSK